MPMLLSAAMIQHDPGKVSGSLLERIDLHMEVPDA